MQIDKTQASSRNDQAISFATASTLYERQEALCFLNRVYVESGLSQPYPWGHFVPSHASCAWLIGVARAEGEIVGTITIFKGWPSQLPSAQYYELSSFDGRLIAEIAGLAVDHGWRRSRRVWHGLVDFAIGVARDDFMAPVVVASVHPRQVQTYRKNFAFHCLSSDVTYLDGFQGAAANLISIDFEARRNALADGIQYVPAKLRTPASIAGAETGSKSS